MPAPRWPVLRIRFTWGILQNLGSCEEYYALHLGTFFQGNLRMKTDGFADGLSEPSEKSCKGKTT
jgi:hypothetical protein